IPLSTGWSREESLPQPGVHRRATAAPSSQAHGGRSQAARQRAKELETVHCGGGRHPAQRMRIVPRKLHALWRKEQMERDLDEELGDHLRRQMQQLIAGGMSPADARAAALRDFGGLEQAREQCREARGVRLLEELGQDLRYGARMLRKRPLFTVVAIVTLAL